MRFLVIISDSLRYDSALMHEGLMGLRDWDHILPCGAQAPYTPSSLTTIATGLHPAQHRYWTFPPKRSSPPLDKEDYIFGRDVPIRWYTSNPKSTYMWPWGLAVPSRDQALHHLRRHEDAVLFVHLWESHIPYEYEHDLDRCIQDMEGMSTLDDRIAYTHHGLDRAVEVMKPLVEGCPEDTVVLVTGDHGEALGEKNPFPEGRPNRWIHEHALLEEMLVPMFISGLETRHEFARHTQIVPTILEDLGLPLSAAMEDTPLTRGSGSNLSICSSNWSISDPPRIEHGLLVYEPEHETLLTASIQHSCEQTTVYANPDQETLTRVLDQNPFDLLREVLSRHKGAHAMGLQELYQAREALDEDQEFKERLRSLGYLS